MSVLYMVRHGQASFGRENYDRLSTRGVEQAGILADFFSDMGTEFDAFYSGTIERQRHTAEVLADNCRIRGLRVPALKTMSEFNEYDSKGIIISQIQDVISEEPGLASEVDKIYTDRRAFQHVFEKVMLRWVTGIYDKPGVESWTRVKERVSGGLAQIMKENGHNKRILLVASGGTISASVQYALGISDHETMRLCWQIVNSSITRFMYNDERITLSAFNAFTHLELKKEKELITYR